MVRKKDKVLVIGAGSWGTAFADYLTTRYRKVSLWVREESVYRSIREDRINREFLPDHPLSPRLQPTRDLKGVLKAADLVLLAVPSKYIRATLQPLPPPDLEDRIIVNLSKGFEAGTNRPVSRILSDLWGQEVLHRWITLSGPSFAAELARRAPTAVVIASPNTLITRRIQRDFSSETLRIYTTTDLTGVEVGGSLKNIIALASGMVRGLGFGYNTTATLVTRGIVEISRFGQQLGGRAETFWGLAGIGDLMLTSFGSLSRNFQLGEKLARGQKLADIQNQARTVAEGVETTRAIYHLSRELGIDMPITRKVYEILFENQTPKKAIGQLMTRRLKDE